MGCITGVGANQNQETGAERTDKSPRCRMWTEGSTEAWPTPGSTAGHLLEQASPGKTQQIPSPVSVLCTCFCGTTDVLQARVEL